LAQVLRELLGVVRLADTVAPTMCATGSPSPSHRPFSMNSTRGRKADDRSNHRQRAVRP
jgi:hypothetical protein